MISKRKILVTSALPYANGPLHLGHLAGAYLPADIYVRYHRLKGDDVVYVCGSDEHGVPIMLRARDEGTEPKTIIDRYHEMNKKAFAEFGMDFDYYGRTSSAVHHETSRDFFRVLAQKKNFVLKKDQQLYDPKAKMFLADRLIRGTCPSCAYEEAYGDQCERCGTSLSPKDLINPRSAITDAAPEMRETTHWYLPLGRFQKQLEEWIATHPDWKPNVLGQIKSWFTDGLADRAMTRDLPWGVAVPEDVAKATGVNAEGKVLYVWMDAPIGYISATKEWAAEKGEPELWKKYWLEQDTELIHFIGKDNIVFHCLIFPSMLMAHGDFVLPKNVPANEFLNLEGNKLSTSRNYAVWLDDYLKNFDADSLRYCLAQIFPETKDTDFSWKDFQARHNNELADILGNFINRTMTFAHKYFDGKVPAAGSFDELDQELINVLQNAPQKIGSSFDHFQMRRGVRELMDVARFANKYFNDQQPWVSQKSDREKCATTVHLCLQTIRALAVLMQPVLPFSAQKVFKMLNVSEDEKNVNWDDGGQLHLKSGHDLNNAEILFRKIEDEPIEKEIAKLQKALKPSAENVQEISLIGFDDFGKADLRVAEVIRAEAVPKTDKLLKLAIRIGEEERTIVAGIAQFYEPETMPGRKIVVVANLEPAKIRGIESQGMLLAARHENTLSLVSVDASVPSGSKIS